jgi:hypothetical protein
VFTNDSTCQLFWWSAYSWSENYGDFGKTALSKTLAIRSSRKASSSFALSFFSLVLWLNTCLSIALDIAATSGTRRIWAPHLQVMIGNGFTFFFFLGRTALRVLGEVVDATVNRLFFRSFRLINTVDKIRYRLQKLSYFKNKNNRYINSCY